jgi:hypothetical protein
MNSKNYYTNNADDNTKKQHYSTHDKIILLLYFSILIITTLCVIFSQNIESFLLNKGFTIIEGWNWTTLFIIFIINISLGTSKVIKTLNHNQELKPETQKRLLILFTSTTILGIITLIIYSTLWG